MAETEVLDVDVCNETCTKTWYMGVQGELPCSGRCRLHKGHEGEHQHTSARMGQHRWKTYAAARDAAIGELVKALELKLKFDDMNEAEFEVAYRGESYYEIQEMLDKDLRESLVAYKKTEVQP